MYIDYEGNKQTTILRKIIDTIVINLSIDSNDVPYHDSKFGITKNIGTNLTDEIIMNLRMEINNVISRNGLSDYVTLKGIYKNGTSLAVKLELPDGSTPIIDI